LTITAEIIVPDFPDLSVETFLKRYGDGKRRAKMEPVYQDMLDEARRLSRPQAMHGEFSLAEVTDLTGWLAPDTVSVVLGLCTLGQPIAAHIYDFSKNDMVSAVVLYEITLKVITALTLDVHASIRTRMQARGLKAGPAYRPGLGRWPLETQGTVFACLPAQQIGVTLNEHLIMAPTKSTSMIIPILDRNQR
jgi:hypothetical protein